MNRYSKDLKIIKANIFQINKGWIYKVALLFLFLSHLLYGQKCMAIDNKLLTYQSGQTSFFTEQDYLLKWNEGTSSWLTVDSFVIHISSNNKTMMQLQISNRFPLTLKLRFPEIRNNVVMEAMITISAYYKGIALEETYSLKIFLFSKEQSFINQTMQSSDLGIIDHTENKDLTKLLMHYSIPFTQINSLADIPYKWIFCSGLDFQNNGYLFKKLYSLLEKGKSILIIPPIKGQFLLPSFVKGDGINLADHNIIKTIDKKLNFETSNIPNISEVNYKIKMFGDYIGIGIETVGDRTEFGWLEFRKREKRMIFCGYNLFYLYSTNPSVGIFLQKLINNNNDI